MQDHRFSILCRFILIHYQSTIFNKLLIYKDCFEIIETFSTMVNAQVIHDEMKMLIGHEDFFFIKVHFLFVFRDAAKKCFGACLE